VDLGEEIMTQHVEIRTTGPGTGVIKIDGKDVSGNVVSGRVDFGVNQPTTLRLDLVDRGALVFEGDAEVTLPAWLTEALIDLGWTPPGQVAEPS
jgi:hypothetical protein